MQKVKHFDAVESFLLYKHGDLVRVITEVFPNTSWQRCIVHLERDIADQFTNKADKPLALATLKAVFSERDPPLVRNLYRQASEQIALLSQRAGKLLEDAECNAFDLS